jgi:hypothetical protein
MKRTKTMRSLGGLVLLGFVMIGCGGSDPPEPPTPGQQGTADRTAMACKSAADCCKNVPAADQAQCQQEWEDLMRCRVAKPGFCP